MRKQLKNTAIFVFIRFAGQNEATTTSNAFQLGDNDNSQELTPEIVVFVTVMSVAVLLLVCVVLAWCGYRRYRNGMRYNEQQDDISWKCTTKSVDLPWSGNHRSQFDGNLQSSKFNDTGLNNLSRSRKDMLPHTPSQRRETGPGGYQSDECLVDEYIAPNAIHPNAASLKGYELPITRITSRAETNGLSSSFQPENVTNEDLTQNYDATASDCETPKHLQSKALLGYEVPVKDVSKELKYGYMVPDSESNRQNLSGLDYEEAMQQGNVIAELDGYLDPSSVPPPSYSATGEIEGPTP